MHGEIPNLCKMFANANMLQYGHLAVGPPGRDRMQGVRINSP